MGCSNQGGPTYAIMPPALSLRDAACCSTRTARPRLRVLIGALIVAPLAGCATPPPAPAPIPVPPPPEPPVVVPCPTCSEEHRELTRLRQELAVREAELRDLRARERDQSKALQASVQQA